MQFSHLTNIEASATMAVNARAAEKRRAGERVYNLSAGEPVLLPHPAIIEGATIAMQAGKTLYPPVAGIPELRETASAWVNAEYGTNYESKNTLVTCGGKFGVFALCQALLSPGDEALVVSPFWVSYPQMVKLFGGALRIIETKQSAGWKVSRNDLEKIETKIKILVLNNATNPTGALYSRDEIKSILDWAKEKDIVVISDEVYSGLVYDRAEYISCGSFPEHQDHVIVVQSCSKHFAMTGWRAGFVFGSEEIIKVLTMLQSQSTTGTSSISQWVALAAFQNAAEIIPIVRGEMQARRNVFIETFQKLFTASLTPPAAGLYIFIAMRDLGTERTDSVAFCQELIEKANIALVPGAAFGVEGYVRASFGAESNEIIESLTALAKY
ncbi:MAG: aminotransferase class I/II-fold pyridoxal phosphate-dependent enzyme, partial [Candidatus Magasanikbacteria bacterium]|nr:aminotransferase class I/II-fold pyridoxal phosphate-dependent enzyme [Candidatus Magasanikbacteria bacterium]